MPRREDRITVISLDKIIGDIRNFGSMPKAVQDEIRSVDRMESRGFMEIHGYRDRHVVFTIEGYWKENRQGRTAAYRPGKGQFTATGFYGHQMRWDGRANLLEHLWCPEGPHAEVQQAMSDAMSMLQAVDYLNHQGSIILTPSLSIGISGTLARLESVFRSLDPNPNGDRPAVPG